jgi:hypothetical protein
MTDPVDPPDLIEANGVGSDLFDAPALFYLTHEKLIRRWAELSERAREATEEFLTTLQPDLEAVGAEHGLVPALADTAGGYRHFFLAIPGTPSVEDRNPAIAFCFGWQRKSFRIPKHTYTPFVAVRVGYGDAGATARALFLDGADGEARRLRSMRDYPPSREWPVWKPIAADERWWTDLDGYRKEAVEAFSRLIGLFIEQMRRTVAELTSSIAGSAGSPPDSMT